MGSLFVPGSALACGGFSLLAAMQVQAAMEIQIIGGAANKIPVALVPFHGPGDQPRPASRRN